MAVARSTIGPMRMRRSHEAHYGTLSNPHTTKFDSARDPVRNFAALAARRILGSVAHAIADTASGLARAALPQHCALCAASSGDALLCAACVRAMPRIAEACPRCALPSSASSICRRCQREPPPFDAAAAAWVYAWPADRLVQELKYRGRLALAVPMAQALARACTQRRNRIDRPPAWPDVLVAVPLAPERQCARGFNQAQEIAKALGAELSLPVTGGMARIRDAVPQAGQGIGGRRASVRAAFAADRRFAGARVGVVDDVMTTGATLAAAAGALREAGAGRIDVWTVARTLPPECPLR